MYSALKLSLRVLFITAFIIPSLAFAEDSHTLEMHEDGEMHMEQEAHVAPDIEEEGSEEVWHYADAQPASKISPEGFEYLDNIESEEQLQQQIDSGMLDGFVSDGEFSVEKDENGFRINNNAVSDSNDENQLDGGNQYQVTTISSCKDWTGRATHHGDGNGFDRYSLKAAKKEAKEACKANFEGEWNRPNYHYCDRKCEIGQKHCSGRLVSPLKVIAPECEITECDGRSGRKRKYYEQDSNGNRVPVYYAHAEASQSIVIKCDCYKN